MIFLTHQKMGINKKISWFSDLLPRLLHLYSIINLSLSKNNHRLNRQIVYGTIQYSKEQTMVQLCFLKLCVDQNSGSIPEFFFGGLIDTGYVIRKFIGLYLISNLKHSSVLCPLSSFLASKFYKNIIKAKKKSIYFKKINYRRHFSV